ncbi:MAG: hypothetical protein WAM60_12555 [Candidatus Promineifilaceae bacterium]
MSKKIILGGLMAVLLFAALTLFVAAVQPFAAFAAGQEQSGDSNNESGETMYIEISRNLNGEDLSGGVFVSLEDPPELPADAPDAHGVFVDRSGDTLTLGTGSIAVTVDVEQINDQEPETTSNASYSGDEVDILLTDNTIFYEDTTPEPQIGREEIEAGHISLTRTLQPGSADDLGEDMILRVWGTMVNGQLHADVVVYDPIS